MAANSPPLRAGDHRDHRFDDFIMEILDDGRNIASSIRGIRGTTGAKFTFTRARIDTMRYNTLFVIPYAINMALIIIFAWIIQVDQSKMKALSGRLCDGERSMYAVISHGLRNRAQIEQGIHLPQVEGDAKNLRANALLLEAEEMEHVSWTLPDCPAIKK